MNAKELILKKINADANWVDIYCSGLMLGESLKSIGDLMMDPEIVNVCNRYASSIFDKKQNYDKKLFLLEEINKTQNEKTIELLRRVKIAEELQFLGKMLKINQGIPTNTTDLYSYIKSIEKYIESVINNDLYNEYLEKTSRLEDGGNFILWEERENFIKEILIPNWIKFDLIEFIKNPNYAIEQINKYEESKQIFNILEVISSVPHFSKMFSTIALNKDILNILSVRNSIESVILDKLNKNYDAKVSNPTKKLSNKEVKDIKSKINRLLIKKWIISNNIRIGKLTLNSINDDLYINSLRTEIEDRVIPILKRKLPNNIFIKNLTLGIKYDQDAKVDKAFWKLPFNMTQIESNPKTLKVYEDCLRAFNDLKYVKLKELNDMSINLVDLFYIYNLIVNDDKFGPNSLTRIFEDIITSPDSNNLLLYNYNTWIDQQNVEELSNEFLKKLTSIKETEESKSLREDLDNRGTRAEIAARNKVENEKNETVEESVIKQIGFDEVSKTLQTIQSDSDQFTPEERKSIKSILGDTKLKVVVASEHTDPMFHIKKVKEQVEVELSKPAKDRKFHMMYIITKHDGLPLKELVDLKIPKFYHFSITTLGGTKYEPGVMKPDDLLDRIAIFIKDGLINPNMVTIRIDPIIPGITDPQNVEHVIVRAKELGIRQFKFSIMNSYGYTDGTDRDRFIVSKMKSLGYDWNQYYDFYNGKYSYNAKPEVISEWYHIMDNFAQKHEIWFNTCGEQPKHVTGLKKIRMNVGCVNVDTINTAMGTNNVANVVGTQRKECSCYGLKTDALCYDDTCASSCAYCYAKHNSNTALKYYDENGILLHNAFTDPYYEKKQTQIIVTYTPKGKTKQTYTIVGDHIYNKDGKEVFKTDSINRKAILMLAKEHSDEPSSKEPKFDEITRKDSGIANWWYYFARKWSKKEGWSVDYFYEQVWPRIDEAWQFEYKLSDDQESSARLKGKMTFSYNGMQRKGIHAKTTLEAIKLGERTSTTRYESDGNIDYWKQAKIGDRVRFESGKDFVIVEVTKPLTKLVNIEESEIESTPKQLELSTDYYDTKPSVESELIAKIKIANIPGLHIVYDSNFELDSKYIELAKKHPYIKLAKGFVLNGEIYINVDKASNDTVIHEFSHLFLADAKTRKETKGQYYQLLSDVRKTHTWSAMRKRNEYQNKKGSDFDEEVLATLIGLFYLDNNYLIDEEQYVVKQVLDLVSEDFKKLLYSDVLPKLNDTFINGYKLSQKAATIKRKLFEQKTQKDKPFIEEICIEN